MLDLIGWARTTSDDFVISAFVTRIANQYAVVAGDAWQPATGDVFTDVNGLIDTVVSVDPGTPTEFTAVNEHAGWADGFATIVLKPRIKLPAEANLRGPVVAFDDSAAQKTILGLTGEYAIATTFSATGRLNPTDWAYASIVEVTPASDLLEVKSAMWFAPQGTKLILNVHASNSFIIKHNNAFDIPQGKIFVQDAGDISVGPGDSVAFIRDTLGSNDRWRAERNSPAI